MVNSLGWPGALVLGLILKPRSTTKMVALHLKEVYKYAVGKSIMCFQVEPWLLDLKNQSKMAKY